MYYLPHNPDSVEDSETRIVTGINMSCDIVMALKELKIQEDEKRIEHLEGILSTYCGCMISKWISVEFKKIVSEDKKEYLQVTFVYLEPFTDFDYYDFFLAMEDIPINVMKLFKFSSDKYELVVYDDLIELHAPYVYKEARALLKKYSKDSIVGKTTFTDCLYISSYKDIRDINDLFENLIM